MVKLIALFRKPDDVAAFDEHYMNTHIPLVRKLPGLRKLEITRVAGTPLGGTPYHLVADMAFDSLEAMNAANASPEGKALARDLMSFAAPYVTVMFGEATE